MEYDHSKNYVGPQGKWYKVLIPRRPLWVDLNYPSYKHDKAYNTGGRKIDADIDYIRDCLLLVEIKDWQYLPNSVMRLLAREVALLYYTCVRDFGKYHYNNNKRK